MRSLFLGLCFAVASSAAQVSVETWGATPDGENVLLYTLEGDSGVKARVMSYGAILVALETPDRAGKLADIVLGFDSFDGYLGEHPYFGAVVGRYGNRIANGRFELDGRIYTLAVNDGPNALHGGVVGFDKQVWASKSFEGAGGVGVELTLLSPDGQEGYPGALALTVRYTLTPADSLRIDYTATTDAPTVLNVTNHAYFNLSGDGGRTPILDHRLELSADHFTPVDATLIPTGELRPVEGTPFDFRTPTAIGERIDAAEDQIRKGGGYDHNYVLRRHTKTDLERAVRVVSPASGRVLEVWTTEPGVQFYTGNFLDGSVTGKGGVAYPRRAAFCFETQHYPDSPNQPTFPSTALRPGEVHRSTTEFRFSAE